MYISAPWSESPSKSHSSYAYFIGSTPTTCKELWPIIKNEGKAMSRRYFSYALGFLLEGSGVLLISVPYTLFIFSRSLGEKEWKGINYWRNRKSLSLFIRTHFAVWWRVMEAFFSPPSLLNQRVLERNHIYVRVITWKLARKRNPSYRLGTPTSSHFRKEFLVLTSLCVTTITP